jgi:hypothetical protein
LRRCLPLALLVLLAVAAAPGVAAAGRPGQWTAVTSPNGANIDQVGLVRTPDGTLHVAWTRKTPGHDVNDDLVHTAIAADGSVGGPQTIVADWVGIGSPTIARASDGSLLIVAGATSTLDPGAIDALGAWRSGDGGATWAQHPGNAAAGGGFADVPALAFGSDGLTPFFGWGTTFGLFVHRGLADTEATGNFQTANGFGCCGYDPGIALDGASGQLVVAWYSNADGGREGIWAQGVDQATGNPVGSAQRMPGSVTTYAGAPESSQSLARTPVVSRPGRAGVYVADAGGYPTTRRVLVWRYGARSPWVLGTRVDGVDDVALAATADGRLWAAWSGGNRIYARRSNPQASTWGAVVSVPARRGTDTIFKLAANAQAGPLDLLAAFAPSSTGDVQTWHTQLRPGLTLSAAPARLPVGTRSARDVVLKVTDAGQPVAGARVTLAGERATTGARGTATLAVGPFGRSRTLTASATKDGWTTARATVRVRP